MGSSAWFKYGLGAVAAVAVVAAAVVVSSKPAAADPVVTVYKTPT